MSDDDKIKELTASLNQAYQTLGDGSSQQPWSPTLVMVLGGSILLFCLVVLYIGASLIKAKDRQTDGTIVLKFFGLAIILCLSAFLMIVGYGQAQLTPIIGLFGAIAGYILGKDANTKDVQSPPVTPPSGGNP